jgi:NADPH:quinone reductase-like Zn-dependent oxidoreductase
MAKQNLCGPQVLKFEDYPDPAPGPGEALVRVAATSVNPTTGGVLD